MEEIMNYRNIRLTLIGIAGTIGALALIFALNLGVLEWDRFFKPKRAAIEREVFLETRSYNEAKLQNLAKLRLEYLRAEAVDDQISMKALESTIRHTFAEYDSSKLPPEMRQFLNSKITSIDND